MRLRLLVQFRPKFPRCDKLRIEPPFLCALQNARRLHITQNGDNFVWTMPSATTIRDGDHIRTLARTQHSNPFFARKRHPRSFSRPKPDRERNLFTSMPLLLLLFISLFLSFGHRGFIVGKDAEEFVILDVRAAN